MTMVHRNSLDIAQPQIWSILVYDFKQNYKMLVPHQIAAVYGMRYESMTSFKNRIL